MRLASRTILIVGGTSGMGLAAAHACLREGANVIVMGRNKDKADAALRELKHADRARAFVGDALDPESVPRAVATAVREFGKLDGLYHTAGGSGRKMGDGPLHTITDPGWRATVDWNLTTIFHSNRAAVTQFLKQSSPGAVLNLGSVLAESPSTTHFATHAYAAAKAAAIGFTRACAAYYAKHDIRFNLLVPALIETPMSRRSTEDPVIMQYMSTKQPLAHGKPLPASELDDAVVFFLGDAARFVTGQVLTVDAGWSVTEGQYPAGAAK
jgi:NAD(P)-dependent dehydrogenase (short-subunit alcohol dehydrogenase family)